MISLLISILIMVLVLGLVYYVFTLIPLPPPFGVIVQVLLAVIAVIWIIHVLLGVMPGEHLVL